MKAIITLELVNKSTKHIFDIKRDNQEHTLFEGIQNKVAKLFNLSREHNANALCILHEIREMIEEESSYFFDEVDRYESILEKKPCYKTTKISFDRKYKTEIKFSNAICYDLIELFTSYDKLRSTLDVMDMFGCFDKKRTYIQLTNKYQKKLNSFISKLYRVDTSNVIKATFSEVCTTEDINILNSIDISRLSTAVDSNLFPAISEIEIDSISKGIESLKSKMLKTA